MNRFFSFLKSRGITKQAGFTIIEILVVFVIIGILASIVVISFNSTLRKSRISQCKADEKEIETALEMYYNDFSTYPCPGHYYTVAPWIADPHTCLNNALKVNNHYLKKDFPVTDPWGNQYVWHWHPGSSECTFLMSFGPNGTGDWWAEHNCNQDDDDLDIFFPRPSDIGL